MDKLTCISTFVAVATEQSFSAAARKLGISKVVVSKYVAQLESELGARLLNRTTRKVSLTPTGRAYLERSRPLLEEFHLLNESIKNLHQQARGQLRIAAPSSFSEMHLMPLISQFSKLYPEVEIEFTLSDRYVDIVEEGFDLALRVGNLENSSLVARPVKRIDTYL